MPEDEVDGRSEPKTVGELRRTLARMGDPWEVQLSLGDDDPLPMPSRGGDGSAPLTPDTFASVDDLKHALRAGPVPTNPFLQKEWAQAGLLEKEAMHGIVGSSEDTATKPTLGADAPRREPTR